MDTQQERLRGTWQAVRIETGGSPVPIEAARRLSFVVEGDLVTLFNDPNCPQGQGVYRFEKTAHGLRFETIHDDCPWSGERADDLTRVQWTNVHVCVRWIKNLWPGAVAC